MQAQIQQEFSENSYHFGSVRSPIQCEGIVRGHRRIAEVAGFRIGKSAVGP